MAKKGSLILCSLIILVVTFALSIISPAYSAELALDVQGAVLVDAASGQMLYEYNSDKKLYPASMTKIMTLLLAVEAVEQGKVDLQDTVRASEYACSFGGSQVWLEPGEEFSLKEMLLAIAVGSANDASVAVAEFLGGSEAHFAELMNERAAQLGAKNTHFINSHGLHHDEHYTTPYNMALIALEAIKHPLLLELTSIKEYTFREEPKLVLWNTNKLLWWYQGTDGLKTGTTSQAGRNLTSTVQKDDLRLIGVVMGIDKKNGHFSESIKLYNYGFARFTFKKFFDAGEVVETIPVGKGFKEKLQLVTESKVGAVIEKGQEESIDVKLEIPDFVEAPIVKEQKLGEIQIFKQGKKINQVSLLAAEEIPKATVWQLWSRIISKVVKPDV